METCQDAARAIQARLPCLRRSDGNATSPSKIQPASAAFTLAIDIMGPFTYGKDLATGRMARYALLGTVPIPVPDQLPGAPEVETLEEEHMEGVEQVEGLEEEEIEDQAPGPREEEGVLGEAIAGDEEPTDPDDLEAIQELMKPHALQNITMIEILEDRSVTSLLAGLSRLHARFRCLGVNLVRLHSDREKGCYQEGWQPGADIDTWSTPSHKVMIPRATAELKLKYNK